MFITNNKQEYWWYLILSVLAFFSFYFAIGSYPLFDNNEGLYASIGKMMLLHKKFVIPHLNCVPYIEKPPFLYWLLSGSFYLFGFTAFAARLVTATSALLVCGAILFFVKKIKEKEIGIIVALIFASSIGISIIARMVYFDMLFTFLISGALLSFFYWHESNKIISLRLGYLFFALAVLTKGLVALVVIGGSALFFLILEKDFKKLRKAFDPVGILLFLAVLLPWHIAATLQHKGFFWSYIVEEHFLRFLDKRVPHDYYHGPIYYYLPRMMIYLFPWSFFAPLVFWRTKDLEPAKQKLLRFSWCWLLAPLIFFSLSSAKANYYMVVGMPALAFILGIKLIHLAKLSPKVFRIWSAAILFVVTLAIGIVFAFVNVPHLKEIGWWIIIATVFYGVTAGAVTLFAVKKPSIIIAMVGALIIPMVIIMVSYIKVIQNDISSAEVGIYLSEKADGRTLYLYQDFENFSAVAFYAPGCFEMVDSKSNDLYYGAHLPQFKSSFLSGKEFRERLTKGTFCIVVPAKKLEQFYREVNPLKHSLQKHIPIEKRFDQMVVLGL